MISAAPIASPIAQKTISATTMTGPASDRTMPLPLPATPAAARNNAQIARFPYGASKPVPARAYSTVKKMSVRKSSIDASPATCSKRMVGCMAKIPQGTKTARRQPSSLCLNMW